MIERVGGALIACAVLGACGPRTVGGPSERGEPVGEGRATAALELDYPALAWVPAEASYAVVAASLRDAVFCLRALAAPLWLMAASAVSDAELDGALHASLGVSPLAADELVELGLAIDASAALFSTDLEPTLIVAVRDGARLTEFLDQRRPAAATAAELGGVRVESWPAAGGALSWARLHDDWLAVHVGAGGDPARWLEPALAAYARGGLAAERDAIEAAGDAHRRHGAAPGVAASVFGLARPRALAGLVSRQVPELARCAGALGLGIGRVQLGAAVDVAARTARVSLVIAPAAPLAGLVRALAPPAPPAGYADYRARAGLFGAWAVDWARADALLRASSCGSLDPAINPLRLAFGGDGVRAAHVAAEDLDLDAMSGRGAAWLALSDRRPIDRLLDQVPGLMKRSVRVAGQSMRAIESLGMFPRVTYWLTDRELTLAVGDGVMQRLVGPGEAAGPPWLLGAGVRPTALRGLQAAVSSLLQAVTGYAGGPALGLARSLTHYAEAAVWVTLDDDAAVVVHGTITLATPGGRPAP